MNVANQEDMMAELTEAALMSILKTFGEELRRDFDKPFQELEQKFDTGFNNLEKQISVLQKDIKETKSLVKLLDAKTASYDKKFEKIGRAASDVD
jgi:hypothetical protein